MLIDLLSTSNQISFNIKVAQLFGLNTAVYLSELISINEKAIRKNKTELIDGNAYFTVARKYITDRTTITISEQKIIDETLISMNIIKFKPNSADTIYIDINLLAGLLGADLSASTLQKISKLTKTKTKEEKAQLKRDGLRNNAIKAIKTTSPELVQAYINWIDAVLDRYGTINKATVSANEKLVDDFSMHNLDTALWIVNKTAVGGYNNMQYAIDDYKSKFPAGKYIRPRLEAIPLEQWTGSEVF